MGGEIKVAHSFPLKVGFKHGDTDSIQFAADKELTLKGILLFVC